MGLTPEVLNQCIVVVEKEGRKEETSAVWGTRLGHEPQARESDARPLFAFVAVTAIRAIGDRPALQREALDLLRRFESSDVYVRLQLILFTEYPQEFRTEISTVLSDPNTIDPSFRAVEVAALLRVAWESADQCARGVFATAVERGPDAALLRQFEEHGEDAEGLATEWKRTRLRWFHDRIPAELQELATSLEVSPSVPSLRQQSLDETGGYVGPVTTGGDRTWTPKSPDDLATMPAEELAAFLKQYDPATATPPHGPLTFDGLPTAVSEFARLHPARALEVVELMLGDPGGAAPYISALLSGLGKRTDFVVPTLAIIPELLEVTSRAITSGPDSAREHWRWVVRTCVDVLSESFNDDQTPVPTGNLVRGLYIEDLASAW